MDVLSSRILLRPSDPAASHRFYRDDLGLAVYREFGPAESPSLVFFVGQGLLEVSGRPGETAPQGMALWLQVRDLKAEHDRLRSRGVQITRAPEMEDWGLEEMWLQDPDGVRIVMVEVPADHPLRRDQR